MGWDACSILHSLRPRTKMRPNKESTEVQYVRTVVFQGEVLKMAFILSDIWPG